MALTIAVGRSIVLRPVKITRADAQRLPHSYFATELGTDLTKVGPPRTGPTWASGDEAVATVDTRGVVTAVAAGSATITATFPDLSTATMAITVVVDASQANSYYLEVAKEVVNPIKAITGS